MEDLQTPLDPLMRQKTYRPSGLARKDLNVKGRLKNRTKLGRNLILFVERAKGLNA